MRQAVFVVATSGCAPLRTARLRFHSSATRTAAAGHDRRKAASSSLERGRNSRDRRHQRRMLRVPTSGSRYVRLAANGPVFVPAEGSSHGPSRLSPRPPSADPIPAGSTTVSFDWEYYNAESFGSASTTGWRPGSWAGRHGIQQLVYADNQSRSDRARTRQLRPEVLRPGRRVSRDRCRSHGPANT